MRIARNNLSKTNADGEEVRMILAVIITNIILTIAMIECQKHGELIREKVKASAEVIDDEEK